ncbi:MAG: PEGA domain-containing protein [Methanospirillaceae archaeon]|nr:PEGA domain-containing protein [Methanospirillaceae archaeon]
MRACKTKNIYRYYVLLLFVWICIYCTLIPAHAIVAPEIPDISSEMKGAAEGFYEIISNTDGTRVYFDADFKGFISNTGLIVPVSRNTDPYTTITLEKEGYQTFRSPLHSYPEPGKTVTIHVPMTKEPAGGVGTVLIDGNPAGTIVIRDNAGMGTIPESGMIILANIPSGIHTFTFSYPGYANQTIEEYLNIGALLRLRIEMIPDDTGTISVSSQPQGAEVYLDDVYKGITPIVLPDIPAETYTILLRKDGYSDQVSTVSIEGGKEQAVAIPLSPLMVPSEEFSSRQKGSSPAEFRQFAGLPLTGIAAIGILILALGILGMYVIMKKK